MSMIGHSLAIEGRCWGCHGSLQPTDTSALTLWNQHAASVVCESGCIYDRLCYRPDYPHEARPFRHSKDRALMNWFWPKLAGSEDRAPHKPMSRYRGASSECLCSIYIYIYIYLFIDIEGLSSKRGCFFRRCGVLRNLISEAHCDSPVLSSVCSRAC